MKIKDYFKHYFCLLLLAGALIGSITACKDNDSPINNEEEEEVIEDSFDIPTVDIPETYFRSPAVVKAASDELVQKLQARLTSTSSEITQDTKLIILDNFVAQQIVTDDDLYDSIKKAWINGATLACVNPGDDWFMVYTVLKSAIDLDHGAIDWENYADGKLLKSFSNMMLHAVTSNGAMLLQDKIHTPGETKTVTVVSVTTNENGEEITKVDKEERASTPPTDYQWGQKAEEVLDWISEQQEETKWTRAGNNSELPDEPPIVWSPSFTLRYMNAKSSTTLQPNLKVYLNYRAGYSQQRNADMYDIQLRETFPGQTTWKGEYYVHKYFVKWKFKHAGYSFAGLKVKTWLSDAAKGKQVEIYSPAPRNEAGQTQVTHDPGGWSIGVNASLAKGGVLGGGLSTTYSTPKDITVSIHKEIPVVYDDTDGACWTYKSSSLPKYTGTALINKTLHNPADITIQASEMDQAVSFCIYNSNEIGKKDIYLNIALTYSVAGAWGDATEIGGHTDIVRHPIDAISLKMPAVNRFFMRYLPTAIDVQNQEEWTTLRNRFMVENLLYKTLCDDKVTIGSPTKEGVTEAAREIWRKTIRQLIETYQSSKVTSTYTIVLQDENGNRLPEQLVISPDGWKMISK